MTSGADLSRLLLAGALGLALSCAGGGGGEAGAPLDGKADGWGEAGAEAPSWLLAVEGSGTWQDEEAEGAGEVVYAWVDARVANTRYDKRVFVEVLAPYEGGSFARVLLPASYRGGLGGGRERWGTDGIEIYPEGGPFGASLAGPVLFRFRLQHDADGDGEDEMVMTGWGRLYGEGEPVLPEEDPWLPGITSPVRAEGSVEDLPEVFFAPFDDPGRRVIDEIDRIIDAERREPEVRHTLHAAVFNITDDEIVDHLIAAHEAGVEVRLLFDARKLRPWYDWYTGDDRLLAAGVPLLGIRREGTGCLHDKIALFDGESVATGSFNWETGARFENHENMLLTSAREVVSAYAARFEALAGGVARPRADAVDPGGRVSVSFAPDEAPHRVVGRLIAAARSTIRVAMFTAKDVEYDDGGRRTSILRELVAARRRGVEVTVIVDYGIHEASEYHGVLSEDDQTDEWLESEGVHVVRADNTRGAYSSMHHKFAVIDDEVVVTGAFNWYYDAAYRNDEDQIVWRDPRLAARYTGEVVDLLRQYDPDFDPAAWPAVEVTFDALCGGTAWGDQLVLVGDQPELGGWDPAEGVELSGETWPHWRGTITLPIGVRLAYKLLVRHPDGRLAWERGENRRLAVPVDVAETTVAIDFRR